MARYLLIPSYFMLIAEAELIGHFGQRGVVGFGRHIYNPSIFFHTAEGEDMNMGVGDIHTHNFYANPLRFQDTLDPVGNLLNGPHNRLVVLVRQILELINRCFRHYQDVARCFGMNIQKSQRFFILIDFMGRDFAFDNFRKNTICHYLSIELVIK
jgi:hypothetical protein